jgi:hypothetical protein
LELFKLLWVAGYGIISEHGNKFRAVIEG